MPRASERFEVERVRPDRSDVRSTTPNPLGEHGLPPEHPGMARTSNSMHDDSYASDVSRLEGPTGSSPEVHYFRFKGSFGGLCPGFALDEAGWLYTISFARGSSVLLQIDPGSLRIHNAHALPGRKVNVWDAIWRVPGRPFVGLDRIFKDTSGGAYFFVDRLGRVVVPALDDTIKVLTPDGQGGRGFHEGVPILPLDDPMHDGDNLVACLPDWGGADHPYYWFATQRGVVGLVDGVSGTVVDRYLLWTQDDTRDRGDPPERIQNSFAVGRNGVFITSNFALYRFRRNGRSIERVWWASYCRLDDCGSGCPDNDGYPKCKDPELKPGQIDRGSGTTPTLLGDEWVAIGDGQRRMNVCIYRQSDGKCVDRQGAFHHRKSACENSFVGYDGGVVAGNTYGYSSPFLPAVGSEPGLLRVGVSDSGVLDGEWSDPKLDVMSAPPTLSIGSGLLYTYTAEPVGLGVRRRWSLLGVCWRTGQVRYRVPIETEWRRRRLSSFDNAWGTMTVGPDRSLFICTWKGFMRVRDG